MSTTLDLITDALQDIGVVGLNNSELYAEDLAKALRLFNRRGSNWNTKQAFKKFERMQTFPVTVSQQSYTIGHIPAYPPPPVPGPDPDFIVEAGEAPVKLDHGNWIVGTGASALSYPIEIITVETYRELCMPAFTGIWPYGMYYQRTLPNATLWPWPVPTDLVDGLQLFWWDQFTPVAIADIALELAWPEGYELAFTLTLAEDCCLPFQKERSEQLREAAALARADIASLNSKPPTLDTTGLVGPTWGGYCP